MDLISNGLATSGWMRTLLDDFAIVQYMPLLFAVIFGIELLRRSKINEVARQGILLAVCAALIAWLDWRSALLMFVLTSAVYAFSGYRDRLDISKQVLLFTAASVVTLIAAKTVFANWSPQPIVIVGLSYYVLRLISVVIEIGRKNPDYADIRILPFFTYIYFVPIFFAGPVQKYADFRSVQVEPQSVPQLYAKLALIVLAKMALVDYVLLQGIIMPIRTDLVPAVASFSVGPRLGLFAGHGFISIVYHYLDFVVYTEIAKGLGRLLGYHVIDNFNYPLLATNIADFWRRWHMSLSNWSRDYVFTPIMIRSRRVWLGSVATMLMIGLWHAVNINWLLWALAHGGALVFYDSLRRSALFKKLKSAPKSSKALGIAGWASVLLFIGTVNNLVAFPHNYPLAWTFTKQALLGVP